MHKIISTNWPDDDLSFVFPKNPDDHAQGEPGSLVVIDDDPHTRDMIEYFTEADLEAGGPSVFHQDDLMELFTTATRITIMPKYAPVAEAKQRGNGGERFVLVITDDQNCVAWAKHAIACRQGGSGISLMLAREVIPMEDQALLVPLLQSVAGQP